MLKTLNKLNKQNVCRKLSRNLHSSSTSLAINKFRTTTREYILQNEKIENALKLRRECAGLQKAGKEELSYANRNPRLMEQMGLNKPGGFSTLHESRNFYNKLNFEVTSRHTKAFVEHIDGEILCYASTTEPYIAAQLHNMTDVMAVVNVARVLAERCKQIGITRVHWRTRLNRTTEKMREFEGTLANNGIILSEQRTRVLEGPSQTLPPAPAPRVFPGPLRNAQKRKGTIYKKDRKNFINTVSLDG